MAEEQVTEQPVVKKKGRIFGDPIVELD